MSASTPLFQPVSEQIAAISKDQSWLDGLLLSTLAVQSSLYHLGQYCGSWAASTSGRASASFHLVLHGTCTLQLPEHNETLTMNAGDGVFFLRDVPHVLSSEPNTQHPAVTRSAMIPLARDRSDSTGLACGFFQFRPGHEDLLTDTLPDYVLLQSEDVSFSAARSIFELLLSEAHRTPESPSPVIERLADLLIFYVLRHLVTHDRQTYGLFALARDPGMAGLLRAILAEPQARWSLDDMAKRLHMARATFHRHFTLLGGTTPAQLLQFLRMRVACRLLEQGVGLQNTAERVGYQSQAAFSRAFQKCIGHAPSAWKRDHRRSVSARDTSN